MKNIESMKFAPISADEKAEIARIFVDYRKETTNPNIEPTIEMGRKTTNHKELQQREFDCVVCGAKIGDHCKSKNGRKRKKAHHLRGRSSQCSFRCAECANTFGHITEMEFQWMKSKASK